MKIMIGIPCMEKVDTSFFASMLSLKLSGEVHYNIKKSTLVYDARNEICMDAINQKMDRLLMIDSDMRFDYDLFTRMNDRLNQGCEMICGLFFKRVIPTAPVIYTRIEPPTIDNDGKPKMNIDPYYNYPKDSLFEVEGCGFGAVMMNIELVKAIWDTFGPPCMPTDWCGEDMAFCYRTRQLGRKIWCDSSIKVGHLGSIEFGEKTYLSQKGNNNGQTITVYPNN